MLAFEGKLFPVAVVQKGKSGPLAPLHNEEMGVLIRPSTCSVYLSYSIPVRSVAQVPSMQLVRVYT